MSFTISNSRSAEATIVKPEGRLDGNGAPEFDNHCSGLLSDNQTTLVVDMSGIDYLSSAGLRSLLVVAKKVKAAKGTLVMCSLPSMVAEVMTMSGFASFLTIKADLPQALSAVQ